MDSRSQDGNAYRVFVYIVGIIGIPADMIYGGQNIIKVLHQWSLVKLCVA